MKVSTSISTSTERKGMPELVVAQLAGAMGGLMLTLDHLLPHAPRRYKIVDKDLTRC